MSPRRLLPQKQQIIFFFNRASRFCIQDLFQTNNKSLFASEGGDSSCEKACCSSAVVQCSRWRPALNSGVGGMRGKIISGRALVLLTTPHTHAFWAGSLLTRMVEQQQQQPLPVVSGVEATSAAVGVRRAATQSSLQQAIISSPVDLDHVASLIRSDPLCVHTPNDQGMLPIQVAVHRGHSGLIRVLVEHGADLSVENSRKQTPFLLACQVCHYTVPVIDIKWNCCRVC